MTREEAKTIILKHQFAFASMPDDVIEAINYLVKEEPRWIPVSERLPVENTTVIGANKYGDIYKTELYEDCGEKKWYSDGSFDVPIVAWIPLPEAYKPESEKEDG